MNLTLPAETPPAELVERLHRQADIVHTPTGGGDMVWQRWGRATARPPLLLLHGGFGSWTHWIANVGPLSAGRLVVTCDIPGLGDSAEVAGEVSPDAIAAVVADGLDAVIGAGARFDLAGFSFGGLIGARLGRMVRARMRTYVGVGASGFGPMHVKVMDLKVPKPGMDEAELKTIHRYNLGKLMIWDPARIDDLAVHVHTQNHLRARVRSRGMSTGDGLLRALPDIRARLNGIWGVHDATGGGRAAIMERLEMMRRHQPAATMTVIEDAGHWVMYEAADDFNAALLKLIDD